MGIYRVDQPEISEQSRMAQFPCPECRWLVSFVVPTRSKTIGPSHEDGQDIYRRLRACQSCGTRFTSVERVERVVRRPQTNRNI